MLHTASLPSASGCNKIRTWSCVHPKAAASRFESNSSLRTSASSASFAVNPALFSVPSVVKIARLLASTEYRDSRSSPSLRTSASFASSAVNPDLFSVPSVVKIRLPLASTEYREFRSSPSLRTSASFASFAVNPALFSVSPCLRGGSCF